MRSSKVVLRCDQESLRRRPLQRLDFANAVRDERDADYVENSIGNGDTVRTQHALLELREFTSGGR